MARPQFVPFLRENQLVGGGGGNYPVPPPRLGLSNVIKRKTLSTLRLGAPSTKTVVQEAVLIFKIFKNQSFQNFVQRKILPIIRLGVPSTDNIF